MRAKPSAPATTPSCQSASAPARPISGSSGLKAPIEKQLHTLMKQSSAVLLKARTVRSSPSGTGASSRSPLLRLAQVPVHDLPSGGHPHALVTCDVTEGQVEVLDSERLSDSRGVEVEHQQPS